jgi:hypothetical protein
MASATFFMRLFRFIGFDLVRAWVIVVLYAGINSGGKIPPSFKFMDLILRGLICVGLGLR